jgi:hypothetical protein
MGRFFIFPIPLRKKKRVLFADLLFFVYFCRRKKQPTDETTITPYYNHQHFFGLRCTGTTAEDVVVGASCSYRPASCSA